MRKNQERTRIVIDLDEKGNLGVYSSDDYIQVCSRYAHETGDELFIEYIQPLPTGWMVFENKNDCDE